MTQKVTKKRPTKRRMEFSKVMFRRLVWIFCLHVILSQGAIIVANEVANFTVSIFTASMPVYAGVIVGYFGKAGYENGLKIKGDLALWDPTDRETLTSSNG